ncbi:tautomerase family protein [Streptomyces collinus]|uniref:tautomerase family protein n=1 Tax=Streptomyces collinus TaxID=42684 RepID=UPI00332A01C5
MFVFNAHIPANRFSSEQKRVLADALNQSLVQALGIPEGDRFIMISEHGENELFLDPTFMGIRRSSDAMIITLQLGAHRPLEEKRAVAAAINKLVVEALAPCAPSTRVRSHCAEMKHDEVAVVGHGQLPEFKLSSAASAIKGQRMPRLRRPT